MYPEIVVRGIAQSGSLGSNSGCGRLIGTDVEPSVLSSLTLEYEWRVIITFMYLTALIMIRMNNESLV